MSRRSRLLLLVLCPGLLACLWDRDTLASEASGRLDVVEVIAGWFDRNPPRYYEMRLERVSRELERNPAQLALYDDAAVACDRLGRPDEAIAWMEKKKPYLELEPADAAQPNHHYRYLANLGTFTAHRWVLRPADERREHLHELAEAEELIAAAIADNPDAHFGREKYQLGVVRWLRASSEEELAELCEAEFGLEGIRSSVQVYTPSIDANGVGQAVEGLAGMIKLGAGWRSVDLFSLLTATLQAEGRSSVALLAHLRAEELRSSGLESLHPLAEVDGFLSWYPMVQDEREARTYFDKVRAAAEDRHERRTAYLAERLARGEHPDTHPAFWDQWVEPRFPRPPIFSIRHLADPRSWIVLALVFGVGFLVLKTVVDLRRRRSPAAG